MYCIIGIRDERKQFKKGNTTMKKIIKVLAISLVAIMMCMTLVSCSNGPSGTYVSESGKITLKFSGEKVELTYGDSKKTVVEGTFEMGEDEEGNPTIEIELPEVESWADLEYAGYRALLNGKKSYNKGNDNGGDYIEIGGLKYYKQ